jgi:hypothetical protein
MGTFNRLRCPRCGICYERSGGTSEVEARPCGHCGITTILHREAPDGFWSGTLPPLSQLLALAGTSVFCLAALRDSILAMFAFGTLMILVATIFLEHRRRCIDRVRLWNLLIKTYTEMDQERKRLLADLVTTTKSQE